MTSLPERAAADVGYTGACFERAGTATAEVLAIPAAWYGKFVDFELVDSATTNISYILFGADDTVTASISPTVSTVDGVTKAMGAVTGGSHIRCAANQPRSIRIPKTGNGIAFFSHVEGAASGRLKMTLSTGDGQ